MEQKKCHTMPGAMGKSAISIAVILGLAMFSFEPEYTNAYVGCEPVASAISASVTDEEHIYYRNNSSYCVIVGLAIYKLSSADTTQREFHYATTRGLYGGTSYTIAMPIPPCAYLIDVFVGDPIKDARVGSAYGSRLLFERVVANHVTPYCGSEDVGRTAQQQPTAQSVQSVQSTSASQYSATPLPSPRRTSAPLPSPKSTAMPVPLPSPEVLGVATSTNPLSTNTGGDATVPLALLGSVAVSGAGWYITRRQARVPNKVRKPVGLA